MKIFNRVFLVFFVTAFLISSCNLPISQDDTESPSARLMVSVNTATEYRTGPGEIYDVVGSLNPGQSAEVIGTNQDKDYLLILDPANPGSPVWLENDAAMLTGVPIGLPISTPPPPPTLVATPIPVASPTLIVTPPLPGGCPTPIGGGPTPVSCPGYGAPIGSGCPTPIGGGPTPVTCLH